ncbi:MAG: sigma-70 family RNA polymerase sigma factor [Verrucomicrobia bacterium]|nr:sigma-70 family RNA polymerase sigma factor [Verrucomicrobiota bacterium]
MEDSRSTAVGPRDFRTTHWSVVLEAGKGGSSNAPQAMAELCRTYWYPLYAYVRRRGHSAHDAEDLTQEFFARLLEKEYLEGITREGGKFRSFLLTAVKRFLANQWERSQAQKRGGGETIVSIDETIGESRYQIELPDKATPEELFERSWAVALIDQVFRRLQDDYRGCGKSELFDRLQSFLSGDKRLIPYAEVGASLEMSDGAVKVAVHRLRKRYGELLREEIAHTVSSPEEVNEEIRHLLVALGR